MKFHISHKTDGIYQGLLVEASNKEIAEAYFKEQMPENRFLSIREARSEDLKPGKPVMVVPEDFKTVKIDVGAIVFSEDNYLEGVVTVDGTPYPFDYNMKTEAIDVHCYSAPGWLTGSSYEKPLPEVVVENMEEIDLAICGAVDDFLERVNGTLDSKLAGAKAAAMEVGQSARPLERDFGL